MQIAITRGMISPRSDQHKPAITIATIDITPGINFKPDARMAKRNGDIA
jgi:hypothetical protein